MDIIASRLVAGLRLASDKVIPVNGFSSSMEPSSVLLAIWTCRKLSPEDKVLRPRPPKRGNESLNPHAEESLFWNQLER